MITMGYMSVKHIALVTMSTLPRVSGLTKLGTTPGGGGNAGILEKSKDMVDKSDEFVTYCS